MTGVDTRSSEVMGVHLPPLAPVTPETLSGALKAGWTDFRAAPQFGAFFAAVYAVGGLVLWYGLFALGQPFWFVIFAAGFPLFAPFAAVGLYEVSRRRQQGLPLAWGGILGALKGHGDGQLPAMAVIVLLIFGFWVILARALFAIFLGESGIGATSLSALWSPAGVAMLVVGTVVGGVLAFVLFSITVFSLPMLLDRPVDFVSAIVTSVMAVRANFAVMMRWAVQITVLLILGMLPAFLGLFIVLPVLGHATWHLYVLTVKK